MIREFVSDSSVDVNPEASSASLTSGRESCHVKNMCSFSLFKHRFKTSSINKTTCGALVLGSLRAVNSVSAFYKLAAANCRAHSTNKLSTKDLYILIYSGPLPWFLKAQPSVGCLCIEPRPGRDTSPPSKRDTCPRVQPRVRPLQLALRWPKLGSRETPFSAFLRVHAPLTRHPSAHILREASRKFRVHQVLLK
jgi:hypothetical protein